MSKEHEIFDCIIFENASDVNNIIDNLPQPLEENSIVVNHEENKIEEDNEDQQDNPQNKERLCTPKKIILPVVFKFFLIKNFHKKIFFLILFCPVMYLVYLKTKYINLISNVKINIMFIVLVIAGIILFSVFFNEIKSFTDDYISFLETDTGLAIFVFFVIYSCSTPFCIPSTFFMLFGSFTFSRRFGLMIGFIIFTGIDFACQMIGVVLAFLNSRYLFRRCVQRCIKSRPKLMAISLALTHNAKKLVFLLRASNITPYDPLNYTCGITDMSIFDYIIGNLGIVICDAPTIYFYSSISDISNVGNSSDVLGDWYYVILSASIAVTIIVVIAVFFYTRRELKKTLTEIEAKSKCCKLEKEEDDEREEVKEQQNNENAPNQTSHSSVRGKLPLSQSQKIWPVLEQEQAA